MSRRILVVPANHAAGVKAVCHAMLHALDERGVDVGYIKPLGHPLTHGPDESAALARLAATLTYVPEPLPATHINSRLAYGATETLMEEVVELAEPLLEGHEVVIAEGLAQDDDAPYADDLNAALARTLDAEVVLVASARDRSPGHVAERFAATVPHFSVGGAGHRITGVVINRLPAEPAGEAEAYAEAVRAHGLRIIAMIPQDPNLAQPRMKDIVDQLHLEVINAGDTSRRVRELNVAAQTIPGVLDYLTEGQMLLVPGDRHEVLASAALAELNGVKLAGLLLTAGIRPSPKVLQLCHKAMASGLPVHLTEDKTYETSHAIIHLDPSVPADDEERVRKVTESVASRLDQDFVESISKTATRTRLSPAAFRRQLTTLARESVKRIVLPEGAEPRTVQAAIHCQREGIATCVLLATPAEVEATAASLGLALPEGIEIIDPSHPDQRYVDALVERRKHKGLTEAMAHDMLGDTVVLGTMMLHLNEVDGLVSGAVHTTANTIRPALQILGTKPGASLVSSVFFMGLPDEVVVYGDCAVNPDPDAEQLADIAIQSADSARAFGLDPKVAMISFSTGTSGSGADIEKVQAATARVRQLRPDIVIDGPLQYDAATTESVARSKAPGSPVAGHANVFVFPDLNTGNTTYKAVQRSASVISIGPMLQGIAKPVNDLSRGALVEDIIYTIALTAIQAGADEQDRTS